MSGNRSGEEIATVILRLPNAFAIICEVGHLGAPIEMNRFPRTAPPPSFSWADPSYEVVHASIVACHAAILAGLRGERTPEITGKDNLRTMRLVFQVYESASRNKVVRL